MHDEPVLLGDEGEVTASIEQVVLAIVQCDDQSTLGSSVTDTRLHNHSAHSSMDVLVSDGVNVRASASNRSESLEHVTHVLRDARCGN